MIIEEWKQYKIKCDFCGSEYEMVMPPGPDGPAKGFVHFTYGENEYKTDCGHMCDGCFSRLHMMWEAAGPMEDTKPAEPEAGKPDPVPERERTCRNCEFCIDRSGKGRGTQYKCGPSGAWFLTGHDGCDAWRLKK